MTYRKKRYILEGYCHEKIILLSIGSTSCMVCQPGKYSNIIPSLGSCQVCAVGNYNTYAEATTCDVCSIGTFTNTVASPVCQNCSEGMGNTIVGSTICTFCTAGYYGIQYEPPCSNIADLNPQITCPSGTWSLTMGMSAT